MGEVKFQRVIATAELTEGKTLAVHIDGRNIIVCHTKEGWHAVDNVCTHAYAELSGGRLRGFRLICPLHGASFDCRTGAILGAPAIQPLKTYPVRLIGDHVEVGVQIAEKPRSITNSLPVTKLAADEHK